MSRNRFEAVCLSLVICLCVFHIINNYLWLKYDQVLLADDPFAHHLNSLMAYRFLESGEFFSHPLRSLSALSESSHQYGLFVPMVSAPFYFIFGVSQDSATMVNSTLFLSLLIFSVYGIGKRLAGSGAGLLSAFIVSMYPVIFNHSRMYMLDLPLAALVGLGIYLLIRSEFLKRPAYIFLFFLVSFLGLLTKINFIVFVFVPLLIIAERGIREIRKKTAFILISIVSCISVACLCIKSKSIFGWLLGNFYPMLFDTVWQPVSNVLNYLLRLSDNGLSFILTIFFGVGVWYFVKSDANRRFPLLFSLGLAWLMVLSSAVVKFPNDAVRYSMPLLVFIAVITGIGLTHARPARARMFLVISVIFISLVQFFAVSWGIDRLPAEISARKADLYYSFFKQQVHIPPARNRFSHPAKRVWDADQIWQSIESDAQLGGVKNKVTTIAVLDPLCELFCPLAYKAAVEARPVRVISVDMTGRNNSVYLNASRLGGSVMDADYVVATQRAEQKNICTEDHCLTPPYIEEEKVEAEAIFYRNRDSFVLLKESIMPDKIRVFVYKNVAHKRQE